jgi:hypothetical protein
VRHKPPHALRTEVHPIRPERRKEFKITERINFEFRAEFLNAFNNINFLLGSAANDATTIGGFSNSTFGQLTNAYQDTSTTNDPGGRMIQFVARINF